MAVTSGGEGDSVCVGGTLIFPYIRMLVPFFGVKNFEFQYSFNNFFRGGGGGGQKNEYCFGYLYFWIFLGGHHKIGLVLGVISMHFLRVKVQNGGYFWGCKKFKKFLGCLISLTYFFCKQ